MREVVRQRRLHAVAVSRSVKGLFRPGGPVRVWMRLATALLLAAIGIRHGKDAIRRAIYRNVFTVDGETLRTFAHHVLADLREFTFARSSAFDPDPIIMARRQGRRDVWLRISGYLNLDEEQVQKLMEIDDGI